MAPSRTALVLLVLVPTLGACRRPAPVATDPSAVSSKAEVNDRSEDGAGERIEERAQAEMTMEPKTDPREQPAESTDVHDDAYWRKTLTPEEYRVLREKGTERAFTGKYWDTTTAGVYGCAGCGEPLFRSDAKFESGCGWPSFFEPLEGARLTETRDTTAGMVRTEITCKKCGGHLGHVFNDGPDPTGLRYCINSVSIDLKPKTDAAEERADK